MAARGGVRVEGLNQMVRDLEHLGVAVDDLKAAFSSISREGAEKAAEFAPRRTGRLAESVRGSKSKNKAVVAAGGGRVKYAAAINYGSPRRRIRASGFMQRADRFMQPIAVRRIDEEINKAIRKAGLDG